jgi:hypothetical protein
MERKKVKKKSYVISMRISDEERVLLEEVMKHQHIRRVSDLVRQGIELVKRTPSSDLIGIVDADQLSRMSNQYG